MTVGTWWLLKHSLYYLRNKNIQNEQSIYPLQVYTTERPIRKACFSPTTIVHCWSLAPLSYSFMATLKSSLCFCIAMLCSCSLPRGYVYLTATWQLPHYLLTTFMRRVRKFTRKVTLMDFAIFQLVRFLYIKFVHDVWSTSDENIFYFLRHDQVLLVSILT